MNLPIDTQITTEYNTTTEMWEARSGLLVGYVAAHKELSEALRELGAMLEQLAKDAEEREKKK